jgi:hypothetical protein
MEDSKFESVTAPGIGTEDSRKSMRIHRLSQWLVEGRFDFMSLYKKKSIEAKVQGAPSTI